MPDSSTAGPLDYFRETTVRILDVAGRAAERIVASETFSAVVAGAAKTTLDVVTPLRRGANQLAEMASEWANFPTRTQMLELARRVNRLELILDDLDVKTDRLLARQDGDTGDGEGG